MPMMKSWSDKPGKVEIPLIIHFESTGRSCTGDSEQPEERVEERTITSIEYDNDELDNFGCLSLFGHSLDDMFMFLTPVKREIMDADLDE